MTLPKDPPGPPPDHDARARVEGRPTTPPEAPGTWSRQANVPPYAQSGSQPPRARTTSRPPPGSDADARHSRPPRDQHDERSPFERILPELLKRGLEASRGTIGNVSDTLFSRDLAASLVSQLGDMREGVVSAVAQEVGRFLRQADIAAEVRNVLTGMEVEAQVKIKFRKSDQGGITTDVEIEDPPRRGRRQS